MTVPVSEVFGPVWQGEGPHAGRRVSFLRLGLCNLHCEWCDTPYTWDYARYDVGKECPPRTAREVIGALLSHGTRTLVLSGGEPVIHAANPTLRDILDSIDHDVHVETNGTLVPNATFARRVAHWSVSPKIGQDADPEHRRIRPHALSWYAHQDHAILKVVARNPADVRAVAERLHARAWGPWTADRVWIMPEGTEPDALLATARTIAPAVADHGYHLSLRQQTLLYGTERGR
jgi:7-carboxy-7-deazaguanine synthase